MVYWTEWYSIVYVHVSRSYDVIHSRMRTSSFPVYKLFCTMPVRLISKFEIKSLLLVPLLDITLAVSMRCTRGVKPPVRSCTLWVTNGLESIFHT